MDKLKRHVANVSYITDEHLPFQKVLEVKPKKAFIKSIYECSEDAPYGKVWMTGYGPLSFEEIENSYFLFQYAGTTLPNWVENYKVIVSKPEIDGLNAAITRSINWLGSIYGIIKIAEAFGVEHDLDRIKKMYENTLYSAKSVTWWEISREEIDELAELYDSMKKKIEENIKSGMKIAEKAR